MPRLAAGRSSRDHGLDLVDRRRRAKSVARCPQSATTARLVRSAACSAQRQHARVPCRAVSCTGADAGAVVTVEVLVEQQQVVPSGDRSRTSPCREHRPPFVVVLGEDRHRRSLSSAATSAGFLVSPSRSDTRPSTGRRSSGGAATGRAGSRGSSETRPGRAVGVAARDIAGVGFRGRFSGLVVLPTPVELEPAVRGRGGRSSRFRAPQGSSSSSSVTDRIRRSSDSLTSERTGFDGASGFGSGSAGTPGLISAKRSRSSQPSEDLRVRSNRSPSNRSGAHRHQPDQRRTFGGLATVGHPHQVVVSGAVLLVPRLRIARSGTHRHDDPREMHDELRGPSQGHRVVPGEARPDLEHPLAVEHHPGGAVRLLERLPAPGGGARRSKVPMLSRPRKPPWNRFGGPGCLRLTRR